MLFKDFAKLPIIPLCCDSYEVTRSSNTIRVQLQMIQYIFRVKILSEDTSSFQITGLVEK